MNSKRIAACCLFASAVAGIVWAGIPEPDAILYGHVCINGDVMDTKDNVTVGARVGEAPEPVGSYHIGDQANAGDHYVLRLRLESPADGAPQSLNAARIGQTAGVFVKRADDAETQVATFLISDRGVIQPMNLVIGPGSDLRAFARLQNCFTGSGGSVSPACQAADINSDGKVDLSDYASVGACLTGPR